MPWRLLKYIMKFTGNSKMTEKYQNTKNGFFVRAAALALMLAILLSSLVVPLVADEADAEEVDPYAVPVIDEAPYIYLYNFENNTVLFEKGEMSNPVYPTSTVKIMAGITAIEALGDDGLSKTITVTEDMLAAAIGNKVGFKAGEVVSAEQMLCAMLVNGANDAAIILAHIVAGGVEDFVYMMNEKAIEIGALSTSYANPTGMHSEAMYTTTSDTVTVAKYAYENSLFMEIVSRQMYQMDATNMSGERKLYNRNCLMSKYYRSEYFYEYALGMNAGSTTQGGYASVSIARSPDGLLTYLCVIMGAEAVPAETEGGKDKLTNYSGAIEMFNWAFRAYGYRDVLSPSTVVCEVPVKLSSTADYITLVPAEKLSVFLPANIDIKKEVKITSTTDENISAPIIKGQKLGSAKVIMGDVELGRVDLIATSDISRSEFLSALERIGEFTKSKFFIATVISAVVLSVIYVLFTARVRQKRLRSRVPRNYRR